MSETTSILDYGHKPSRQVRLARVIVILTLILIVVYGIRLAYKHMPPLSTEGYRVCTSCGRYDQTTTSWFGLAHGVNARPSQFLEQWLAKQGTPCAHTWRSATTSRRYFLTVESETGGPRGSPVNYINSAMLVHQLTDDDVRELLRLDKAGKAQEFYTFLADLQRTRPKRGVPTTAPAQPSTKPSDDAQPRGGLGRT